MRFTRNMSAHMRSTLAGALLTLALTLAADIAGEGVAAAELTFDLRIERGRVREDMRTIRVKQDDIVKVRCTADRALTLHLHGYDIEKRIGPGTVGELTFTANATGRFPIHLHDVGARTGSHSHEEPPLAHIEVYPR